MRVLLRAMLAVCLILMARPGLLAAQSAACVSDTTEDAKIYRDGYRSMVSRTDSMSVAQRTALALPTLSPSAVTIVTDSATCATASAAYDNAVGVAASTEAPIVLKLGTQWVVIKQLDFPGVSPNVVFNQTFAVAQSKIWF
jgi:hypothetical protein